MRKTPAIVIEKTVEGKLALFGGGIASVFHGIGDRCCLNRAVRSGSMAAGKLGRRTMQFGAKPKINATTFREVSKCATQASLHQ